MGLLSTLRDISRALHLARKPDKGELWQMLKICLLAFGITGSVGFVIHLIMSYWLLS
ncbi:protein translocase SEC61 complex subunit gamma [archaeon]|nr:protein translocase SEC61 complex subunit gamma [archaeon]